MIAQGNKRSTLYMTMKPSNVIVVAAGNDDASLWHNKLGHISQKRMKKLWSKGKLPELKNVHFDICENWIIEK